MLMIIQLLPIFAGVLCAIKRKISPITFYVMFLVSICGVGFYYNNIFRIGPIFHTDIYLVMFVLTLILCNHGDIAFNRSDLSILVFIVCFELVLGFISGYELGDVFGDFKLIVYYFVPYIYGKMIKANRLDNIICFMAYCGSIVITLVLNWIEFFNTGLVNISNGGTQIIRTFGIGLGFSCGTLVICLLMDYKSLFVRKFGIVLYYIIHIGLIVSVAVSFTRTSWISCIIIVIINSFLVAKKNKKDNTMDGVNQFLREIIGLVVVVILVIGVIKYSENHFPEIYNSIRGRFASIFVDDTTMGNEDTLSRRFTDVASNLDVFASPRIIIGYGMGALYRNSQGSYFAQTENSYIYYMWKYGLIAAGYLFSRIVLYLRKKMRSSSVADRTFAINCFFTLVIGSMSGTMNQPYSLAAIGILMSINWGLIFKEKNGEASV